MAAAVTLLGLTRHYAGGAHPAVDELELVVSAGEVVSLVGPSGCGKSTTLRMVAGLEKPDRGRVLIAERDVTGVPPQERDVAMVFQGFALYPHMRVRDILAFPLKMRKQSRSERDQAVAETASLLGLDELLDRFPGELSGGEQQRVAMGRAIVRKPQVFLFDEPLSNLDAALRAGLRVELGKLLRRLDATALYVTHDQTEAMTLSHRIVLMRDGHVVQDATPREIYEHPKTIFCAQFFGNPPMNILELDKTSSGYQLGSLKLVPPANESASLKFGIRPEHLVIEGDAEYSAMATLCGLERLSGETHLELEMGSQLLRAKLPGLDAPAIGAELRVGWRGQDMRWFDRDSEGAL